MVHKISAIVLAAGASLRMGTCKQLLTLGNKPTIAHCLETIIASGIIEIIVVTGANGDDVAAAVSHFPVKIVRTLTIDGDMADSVKTGLGEVSCGHSAVMICLADQPLVAKNTCLQLLRQHSVTPKDILIPVFKEQKGHPTIFPISLLKPLLAGWTVRDVIRNNPQHERLLECDDQGVVLDMDFPSEYQAMREYFTGNNK
jgi:molybdenum cofactor cytidylyltransferase